MKTLTPWLIGFFLIGLAVVKMLPPKPTPGLDIDGFARLPVLVGGRVMPMDTLGRLSLLANESSVIRITHWIHDPSYCLIFATDSTRVRAILRQLRASALPSREPEAYRRA
jgi:hypothetical protein